MPRNKIQFGRPKVKKSKPAVALSLYIDSLSLDARGVAREQGKTIFVEGALPGETVEAKITKGHKRYDEASTLSISEPSAQRIVAHCPHYQECGACQLQHLSAQGQQDEKQKSVLTLLDKMAKVTPLQVHETLADQSFHYRRSARIGVNQRAQSQENIVGFRRPSSAKLFQVSQCPVLPKSAASLFDVLRSTFDQIDNAKAITHIEYLQGEPNGALTFRVKQTLSTQSKQLLLAAVNKLQLQGYLRTDSALEPLADYPPLTYSLCGLTLSFEPGDFIQINASVNQLMVERALEWLEVSTDDRLLDLFSGLGNFSLPLSTRAASVVGIEGSAAMVARAKQNALDNQLSNCHFYQADLNADIREQAWFGQGFDKILLDPPRTGATDLIDNIAQYRAEMILYIACDPSSLARDSQQLVSLGYEMDKFCVMDMFPNTAHIESMALFRRKGKK